MVVGRGIVSIISFSALHGSNRSRIVLARSVDRNHGWIVATGVLAKVGDFANDAEAGIAPKVALNKADIVNSDTENTELVCCDSSMELGAAYNVAPMANGVPRKTGMTCSSFLYGTEGPSRGEG